jgi:iron complex outermembrane receptor protein
MGIELQAKWRPSNWINVSGNFTLSDNKVIDFVEYYDDFDNGGQKSNQYTKTDIALSPSAIGAATVNVYLLKGLEVDLLGKYVSRQYLDNTNNTSRSLNPYYVQDARAIYTLPHFLFSEISLVLQVNNLFNKKYEPNGYTYPYFSGGEAVADNYYFPMAGTNFMAAVNIKF